MARCEAGTRWPSSSPRCSPNLLLAPASESGPDENTVFATIDGATIEGGSGIFYYPYVTPDPGSGLSLRRSSVTATKFDALTILHKFDTMDLGTPASPGENKLVFGANNFAIVDSRDEVGTPITAHGTTLNGTTFHGDVLGPVAQPGSYNVRAPNTIQFGP